MLKRLEAIAVSAFSLLDEPLCVSASSILSTKRIEVSASIASLSTSSRRLEAGGMRKHFVKHACPCLVFAVDIFVA